MFKLYKLGEDKFSIYFDGNNALGLSVTAGNRKHIIKTMLTLGIQSDEIFNGIKELEVNHNNEVKYVSNKVTYPIF